MSLLAFCLTVACLFILIVLVGVSLWLYYSYRIYRSDTCKLGEEYFVYGRQYKLPDAPEGTINTTEFPLLHDWYLQESRELLIAGTKLLTANKVKYWLSGGTLLGFTRHGTIIPWDDDIDVHVLHEHREYLMGDDFVKAARQCNLEVLELRGTSQKACSRDQACVRIRFTGKSCPIMDIFFVAEDGEHMTKVNGWKNTSELDLSSTKEHWLRTDVFPLVEKEYDSGLKLMVPQNPVQMLQTQYGDNVMTDYRPVPILLSHQAVHSLFSQAYRVK